MASDDGYLSELTDIESDCDESSSKGKKAAKGKASGWKIRMSLKPPRATTYSAQALYDQIHGGDINLEPPYQRDVVWPETKQIMVIDSIFRNFYIPPVIFSVQVHDDGSETKTCIDGKQRLTSIWKFMDGLIPHKDAISGKKLYFKDNKTSGRGPRHEIMPERYRKVFANKQIVCVEYHEISEDDEREVFQRVQLGMALTPAEKLQVTSTPRAAFVRSVLGEYLREDGPLCPPNLNWKTDRGSDFRCLGHSIHMMELISSASRKSKSLHSDFKQVEKWLSVKDEVAEPFQKSVKEAFKIFASLVSSNNHGHVFKKYKKVSPLEFIFVGLLVFVNKDKASKKELADGIGLMFDHVRDEHTDVRMNNRVQKTMVNFVTEWTPGMKKMPSMNSTGQKRKRVTTAKAGKGKKKQKADEEDDDMDVDDEPEEEASEDDDEADSPSQNPKATTKATTARPKSKGGLGEASPPVKTEPETAVLPSVSTPSTNSIPATDRLAALRRTKEQIAQKEAERAAATPVGPRALLNSRTSTTASASNPQMLPSPSPGQSFVVPSSIASGASGSNPSSAPSPLHGPPNGPNAPIPRIPPIRIPAGGHPLPPPPQPSPDRDRARRDSREWDRDRDWGKDRSGRYDDREKGGGRYDSGYKRRDSSPGGRGRGGRR